MATIIEHSFERINIFSGVQNFQRHRHPIQRHPIRFVSLILQRVKKVILVHVFGSNL